MGVRTGVFSAGRLNRHVGEEMDAFGHLTVDLHGRTCRCGNRGCMETVATLPALSALLGCDIEDAVAMPRMVADALRSAEAAGHPAMSGGTGGCRLRRRSCRAGAVVGFVPGHSQWASVAGSNSISIPRSLPRSRSSSHLHVLRFSFKRGDGLMNGALPPCAAAFVLDALLKGGDLNETETGRGNTTAEQGLKRKGHLLHAFFRILQDWFVHLWRRYAMIPLIPGNWWRNEVD